MYKVIKYFIDLQDGNHPYYVGDVFPRSGLEVKPERIAELAGSENRQGVPLIKMVEENTDATAGDADSENTDATAGDDIEKKTVKQLKEYADEKGIDLGGVTQKDEIIAKIKEAETAEN